MVCGKIRCTLFPIEQSVLKRNVIRSLSPNSTTWVAGKAEVQPRGCGAGNLGQGSNRHYAASARGYVIYSLNYSLKRTARVRFPVNEREHAGKLTMKRKRFREKQIIGVLKGKRIGGEAGDLPEARDSRSRGLTCGARSTAA